MSQKLFTIKDLFYINGRNGTVVVGDSQPNSPNVRIKDNIVLVRTNGTEVVAEADGIEMPLTVSGVKKIAIWIKTVSEEDVPVGTEVFLKTKT